MTLPANEAAVFAIRDFINQRIFALNLEPSRFAFSISSRRQCIQICLSCVHDVRQKGSRFQTEQIKLFPNTSLPSIALQIVNVIIIAISYSESFETLIAPRRLMKTIVGCCAKLKTSPHNENVGKYLMTFMMHELELKLNSQWFSFVFPLPLNPGNINFCLLCEQAMFKIQNMKEDKTHVGANKWLALCLTT